jgi:hypothetical protein
MIVAHADDVTECSLQARHNFFRKLALAPSATFFVGAPQPPRATLTRRRCNHARVRPFGVAAFDRTTPSSWHTIELPTTTFMKNACQC